MKTISQTMRSLLLVLALSVGLLAGCGRSEPPAVFGTGAAFCQEDAPAAERARATAEFYMADNGSQGNCTVSSCDAVLDGRTRSINTGVELKYEDDHRADFEAVLNSIRFR